MVFGQARGLWRSNLHNGLLAFAVVGAYVLFQRLGHREGVIFLVTGVVEALLFFGRQLGHSPTSAADRWWGWVGAGRWSSRWLVRRQLAWLVAAVAISVVALVVGLVGWGTPRAGLLSATLVPVAAGWAIVHGQHVAAYSALSWLSRAGTKFGLPPDAGSNRWVLAVLAFLRD